MIRNLDIDLLRAFLTIYETGSFSAAAERLGRTQSTISQQIKKLEDVLGHTVLDRNNRSVAISAQGMVLLPYARKMLSVNDELFQQMVSPQIEGQVRLGAPEAFTATHLPHVLAQFLKSYPTVGLEVQCELSDKLLEGFERGQFDIALFKRTAKTRTFGTRIWHESLIWVASDKEVARRNGSVPLILSPFPCVYRAKMTDTLEEKDVKWHGVLTSHSMTGRIAAAKAGLGITAIPREMLSPGLYVLDEGDNLPPLDNIEIAMLRDEENASEAVRVLAEHILVNLESCVA